MTVLTGLILENKGKHACGNGIKSSIKGPKFVFSLDFSKSTVTGMPPPLPPPPPRKQYVGLKILT